MKTTSIWTWFFLGVAEGRAWCPDTRRPAASGSVLQRATGLRPQGGLREPAPCVVALPTADGRLGGWGRATWSPRPTQRELESAKGPGAGAVH